MKYNPIIFGKAQLENIVSIEPLEDCTEIFTEKDGKITSLFVPNRYWILSHEPLTSQFIPLEGNLYYKYGIQFKTKEDFLEARRQWKYKDIFSIYDSKESFMVKDGYSNFLGIQIEDVSVMSFDIETTTLDPNHPEAKILLISTTYKNKYTKEQKLFAYDDYKTEREMIDAFNTHVISKDPSILVGHNILLFDIPYLHTIASKYGTSLAIGRDQSDLWIDSYESKFRYDGSRDWHYNNVHVYGREIVDTYFLTIKSDISRKYNSYALKEVIKQEGWQKESRVYYDASLIKYNYLKPEEWKKIKDYCKDDSEESLFLYEKFIPPFFYFAQSVPKSFQRCILSASGSQLNSIMIRNYLQNKYSLPKASDVMNFEGAISEGSPGIYKNVVKWDVASLYPSIMSEYKIYPTEKDPNGYFAQLVDYFREERLKNKKLAKETGNEYYTHLEQSEKIGANSLYGFLGSPGLLFNDPKAAAEVTKKGREILTRAMDWAKEKELRIVNCDTDSFSFTNNKQTFIDNNIRETLRKELNDIFPKQILWESDGYYKHFIVIKSKNYVMMSEEGKVKYKGSALKSPTLEPALREFIERIVNSIFEEKYNYKEIYNEYVKEAMTIKDIKRWCSRKTISERTLESERTNESKIRDAIEDTEYKEGDRVYVFFGEEDNLELAENFKGVYNKDRMYEKLHKTAIRFLPIIPNIKELCPNFKLKRNKELLETFL